MGVHKEFIKFYSLSLSHTHTHFFPRIHFTTLNCDFICVRYVWNSFWNRSTPCATCNYLVNTSRGRKRGREREVIAESFLCFYGISFIGFDSIDLEFACVCVWVRALNANVYNLYITSMKEKTEATFTLNAHFIHSYAHLSGMMAPRSVPPSSPSTQCAHWKLPFQFQSLNNS